VSEPLGLDVEEPENRHGAFPRLGEERRARLRALGEVRAVDSGEVLFREGGEGSMAVRLVHQRLAAH
jgi:hypothetical protein